MWEFCYGEDCKLNQVALIILEGLVSLYMAKHKAPIERAVSCTATETTIITLA